VFAQGEEIGPIGFECRSTRNRELVGWRYIVCMYVGVNKIRM
jgi:hypothetical protein